MKTFPKPLSASEERDYLERYKEGDQEARAVLIERNMRLVAHVIKKYQCTDYDMEDLLSVGTIGLIKAVNTFKMDKGSRLATYAAKCVENAIRPQMRLWFQTSTQPFAWLMGIEPNSLHAWKLDQKLHLSLPACFLYGRGFDNRIQKLYLLIGRTI